MSTFSDMLKLLRRARNLTQEEAAKGMQISRSAYANYEAGIREPDMYTLEVIADYYNVNMSTLLGNDGTVKAPEDMLTPSQRMLFNTLRGCSEEEIQQAVRVIEALKK